MKSIEGTIYVECDLCWKKSTWTSTCYGCARADKDKNCYVSINEATEYAIEKRTVNGNEPQLSDLRNLGPTSYLVEYKVDN